MIWILDPQQIYVRSPRKECFKDEEEAINKVFMSCTRLWEPSSDLATLWLQTIGQLVGHLHIYASRWHCTTYVADGHKYIGITAEKSQFSWWKLSSPMYFYLDQGLVNVLLWEQLNLFICHNDGLKFLILRLVFSFVETLLCLDVGLDFGLVLAWVKMVVLFVLHFYSF